MSDKPKKNNNMKIVIIALLILVVVGGATFGGMYFAGKKGSTATAKTKEVIEVTYPLGEFLVNLSDENVRILKVNIFIGYEVNKKLAVELETKKAIIRDLVNTSLRAKKAGDFSQTGIDAMKNELIAIINPSLTKGKVSHIYFNDIFIQ